MSKNKKLIIIIIVSILIIAVGGYVIYMLNQPTSNSTQSIETINNSVVITQNNSSFGDYLADPNGNTLYFYNSDTAGVSNCKDSCLAAWPAYMANSSTTLPASIGTITRSDNGQLQYTYNNMPLYYYVGDNNGQINGHNVENFQVAKPISTTQSSPTTETPSTNNTQSTPSYPY